MNIRTKITLPLSILVLCVSLFVPPPSPINSQTPLDFELVQMLGRGSSNVAEWSTDGEVLAVGGSFGIWLYSNDLQTATHLGIGSPNDQIGLLAWHPDNRRLASLGQQNKSMISIWDIQAHQVLAVLENPSDILSLAWSPDGEWLAVGMLDGTVKIWQVDTWQSHIFTEHTRAVIGIEWRHDGEKLASGSVDGTIHIWDVHDWQDQILLGHPLAITAFQWSHDGTRLASGDEEGIVRIWDMASGQSIGQYQHTSQVLAVAWSPNSQFLASSAGREGEIFLWDSTGTQPLMTLPKKYRILDKLVWNQDGSRLLSTGENIIVWDISSQVAVYELDEHFAPRVNIRWRPQHPQFLSYSGYGHGRDNSLRLWDADTGNLVHTIMEHSSAVHLASFSPNAEMIAGVAWESWLRVWDIQTGALIRAFPAGISADTGMAAWNSDWSLLAADTGKSALVIFDWQAIMQDAPQGQIPLAELKEHSGFLVDILWSPEGSQVLSVPDSSSRGVLISDTRTWQSVSELKDESLFAGSVLAWRPQHNQVAVGGSTLTNQGTIQVWDLSTQTPLTLPDAPLEKVETLAWRPDGQVLAGFQDYSSQLYFWDMAGQTFLTEIFPDKALTAMAWHPSGDWLAISTYTPEANRIHLWDTAAGHEIAIIESSQGIMNGLEWSADGRLLASAGRDGTIHLWGHIQD